MILFFFRRDKKCRGNSDEKNIGKAILLSARRENKKMSFWRFIIFKNSNVIAINSSEILTLRGSVKKISNRLAIKRYEFDSRFLSSSSNDSEKSGKMKPGSRHVGES